MQVKEERMGKGDEHRITGILDNIETTDTQTPNLRWIQRMDEIHRTRHIMETTRRQDMEMRQRTETTIRGRNIQDVN